MIKENFIRSNAILFPTATCNLRCNYCNIDKNPVLKKIDESLEEAFSGDYFYNRILQYFPLNSQLTTIETWGGEPFIHMERIYHTLHKIIAYYPFFDSMMSSTNFSYPEWNDKFFDLMKQFAQYNPRRFKYRLQLSVDGPTEINDSGRGVGTTEKCLNNYKIFLSRLPQDLPGNVDLTIVIKQTLNLETLRILKNKEEIIKYFNFFEENFYEPFFNLGNYSNVNFEFGVPNLATPVPATTEDGLIFSKYCKNCAEIQKEINKYFKYQRWIMPYSYYQACTNCSSPSYCMGSYGCGSGTIQVGFLPNDYISTCNEGFTQLFEEYYSFLERKEREKFTIDLEEKLQWKHKRKLCLTDDEYSQYEDYMMILGKEDAKATIANITQEIVILALLKQIDEKYKDIEIANNAARYIRYMCYCVKDNYNMTGSITFIHIGFLRLLLNGALDYILEAKNELQL